MSATYSAAFTWLGATISITTADGATLRAELKAFGFVDGAKPAPVKLTDIDAANIAAKNAAGPAPGPTTATKGAAQEKTADASTQSAGNAAAESQASTAVTDFETLKKAFLALSTAPDGRTKCEAVLKPFGAAKLSALKPEQYGDAMAKINELGV